MIPLFAFPADAAGGARAPASARNAFARITLVAASVALLSACAVTPAPQAADDNQAGARSEAPAEPPAAPAPASSSSAARAPQLFAFDRMSVRLSESEKANVLALAEQARTADSVLVRGYCDRTEVGNAKDAALARAQAVRNVLVKAGVQPGAIRVRYNTERKMHAAEVELR